MKIINQVQPTSNAKKCKLKKKKRGKKRKKKKGQFWRGSKFTLFNIIRSLWGP